MSILRRLDLRRLDSRCWVVVLWIAVLCPLAGPLPAHEERETREVRDTRDDDRVSREAREDNSGHGSRDDDDRSGKDGGKEGGRHGGRDVRDSRGPRLEFERDRHGAERIRGELIVVGSRADVAALRSAGFAILESSTLASLDADMARVRVPDGRATDTVLDEVRKLVPEASVAANNVFRASGETVAIPVAAPIVGTPGVAGPTIGIVDTGIDAVTPALRDALSETRGFAAGGYVPRSHGTAVGDIAARAGVSLLSADVFGVDENADLAATTVSLAGSIDWLMTRRVRVINISIVGPDNPVVARLVRRAIAADVAIVAAAGNGGPSAPPGYPAAYPGVIAVTAVDERGRVYRRANRGAFIAFAARGVDVFVPRLDGGTMRESGTSFAAPIVAAALALRAETHRDEKMGDAVTALASEARDLGATGRDEIYGWGEVTATRIATARGR